MTLPSAPATISISPQDCSFCCSPSSLASQVSSPTLTASANRVNSQRCQPPAPARKLNAAPALRQWTISSTGNKVMDSCSARPCWIHALVSWSSRIAATPSGSQRRPDRRRITANGLDMAALLRCITNVSDAASAKLRMRGMLSDVHGQVPAARALGSATALNLQPYTGNQGAAGLCGDHAVRFGLHHMHPSRRCDGEETQLIRNGAIARGVIRQRIYIDLGLERSTDGARLAQLLQLAQHGLSQRDQRIPVDARCRQRRKLVPAGEEHRLRAARGGRKCLPDLLGS